MGQQEYDNFKRLIKEWLDNHPDEYADFVEEMNDKKFKGFFKVFKIATKLAPKYKEAARKRIGDDRTPDFEELENILLHSDLAEKIVNEFHNPNKKSIVPAMLAWLYYGRSYECMVEQGEELTQRKDIPKLYKWLISGMVKFIIRKSITNGMRSKEDWQVFRKQQKAIEENTLVEWAIEEDEDTDEEDTDTLSEEQPKTAGRKADTRTLSELLIERHAILIERIGTRLKTHATETDIARLFIALVEYRFMRKCPIKTFRNALHNQFKEQEIVHERGIQKAYRNLISPLGNSKKLIIDIYGKPLIQYSIECAKESKYIDRTIISTDDFKIKEVSERCGGDVPFLRPSELAQDTSKTIDCLVHAVNWLKEQGEEYDYLVLLQNTVPLRKSWQVDEAIEKLFSSNERSLVSITEVEENPVLMRTLNEDGTVKNMLQLNSTMRRQDFPKFYRVDGAIYIQKLDEYFNLNTSLNDGKLAYIMEEKYSVDIDTYLDIKKIEYYLEQELNNK